MKIVKRPQPARTERDQALTAARAERDLSERLRVQVAEQLGYVRGYLACLQAMTGQPAEPDLHLHREESDSADS